MIKSIRTDLNQHAPHLIRSLKIPFLLATCSVALLYPILFTPMRVCLTPKVLINLQCCLICPWISPDLWLSLAMAVAKLPSAGTMISAVPICNVPVVMLLMKIPVPGCNDDGVVTLVRERLFRCANDSHTILPLLPLAIHQECGCGRICPSAPPSASSCQALARKWHPSRVVVVILPPSSCPRMAIGTVFLLQSSLTRLVLMWFSLRLLMARDHLCRAEWISGLRIQCQHREHHVFLDFELSKHESLHSIQLALVHGCGQCSG